MAVDWNIDAVALPHDGAAPLVSLTLLRYAWWWAPLALVHMALHGRVLRRMRGLHFFKLLGSGHGGAFSLWPDWRRWGLFAVWADASAARRFFRGSSIARIWRRVGVEIWTIFLEPIESRGSWGGVEPFGPLPPHEPHEGPVAVLTRATIRLSRVAAFWRAVGPAARRLQGNAGLVMSVGIGEAPVLRQATFSVWRDTDSLRGFAYATEEHTEAVRRTRSEAWYKEDLFARLRPVASFGRLGGKDPVAELLHTLR